MQCEVMCRQKGLAHSLDNKLGVNKGVEIMRINLCMYYNTIWNGIEKNNSKSRDKKFTIFFLCKQTQGILFIIIVAIQYGITSKVM
jgi:hypothetical protein